MSLKILQLERLSKILEYVYKNNKIYQKKFDDLNVKPTDLKELNDIQKFPFTTKADLRNNYPFGLLCVPEKSLVRIHASSGTTGKSTIVGYTQKDIEVWSEVVSRSISAAGGKKGDKVQISYGYGLFTGGLGAHYGAEKLGLTVIPMSGGQTAKQVQFINDIKPEILMVTPSYALNIADEFERQGLDPKASSLKIGIFGAEPWTNDMRRTLESRLSIAAIDIYGLSEIIGPGVACEFLENKNGPTIWEDHFYPEIINPDTGEVLPDGEEGELVITTLTKEAMPIIRYRTGDITRLLPNTVHEMRRLAKIVGRKDDMMILRGVNVYPSQIEEFVLAEESLEPHYLCILEKERNLDKLTVQVEVKKNLKFNPLNLERKFKEYIGVTIKVDVVDNIARSEGKAKRIIDLRKIKLV